MVIKPPGRANAYVSRRAIPIHPCTGRPERLLAIPVRIIFYLGMVSITCFGGVSEAGESTSFVQVPNPLDGDNPTFRLTDAPAPKPGESVWDPRLGSRQFRATAQEGLRHEYARHDPFNVDCSRILLLLLNKGEWRVYKASSLPYDAPGNLIRTIGIEEPRWDEADPRVLWGTREFQIVRVNVESGDEVIVKDFRKDPVVGPVLQREPDLYRITMKDEGETSRDRRYWAFIVQGSKEDYRARYLLVWDRQQDRVLGMRKLSADESRIDWVGMSPKGNWVLVGADQDNGGALPGFVMLDRELKTVHPLHYSTGHADVGLDSAGNEVVVMQNAQTDYIDLIPLEPATKPVLPGGAYHGTGHVPLVRLFYASDSPIGFSSGVHVSCNFPGWCVISTHINPATPEKNWLDRSIILVRLDRDRPRAYYLTKVHGTCGTYWEETHATMSADGSRIVWATNWGADVGREKVWLTEMDLPANWHSRLE